MASLYEKQMLWRKAAQLKAEQSSAKVDELKDCTFTPTLYTASAVKPFEGPAREINEVTTQRHVSRQASARKERQIAEDKLYGKARKPQPLSPSSGALPLATNATVAAATAPSSSSKAASSSSTRGGSSGSSSSSSSSSEFDSPSQAANGTASVNPVGGGKLRFSQHIDSAHLVDMSNDEDLSVVEVLERERRQWHAERIKLIHCIHLQQLELTASASAAQERASSIAKEFARAIEGFEERLVSMESNVQKELVALKAVIVANNNTSNGKSNANS